MFLKRFVSRATIAGVVMRSIRAIEPKSLRDQDGGCESRRNREQRYAGNRFKSLENFCAIRGG